MKSKSISTTPEPVASPACWTKRIRQLRCTYVLASVIVLGLEVFAAPSAQTQTFNVLYSFTGSSDGAFPEASMVMDAMGNIYGTTRGGRFSNGGNGTVFEINKAGAFTVLHSFAGGSTDGETPYGGLVMDAKGNLYGTTSAGGAFGLGTVFKVTDTGKETLLHSFGRGTDGSTPNAGLIMDTKGNLYGTTSLGGTSNLGTVFRVTNTGKETILHSFKGTPDGSDPTASLLMDANGNLYGTTYAGGTGHAGGSCYRGCGTVFKITNVGKEIVLHNFKGSPSGAFPYAGLISDPQGNLYGTTVAGGSHSGGTVFEVTKTGKTTILYHFTGLDGGQPYAGLVMSTDGTLYGTTFLVVGPRSDQCSGWTGMATKPCCIASPVRRTGHFHMGP